MVFAIVGFFFGVAGLQADAGQARGTAGVLEVTQEQAYGDIALAGIAAGLLAYGLYCFTRMAYRHF